MIRLRATLALCLLLGAEIGSHGPTVVAASQPQVTRVLKYADEVVESFRTAVKSGMDAKVADEAIAAVRQFTKGGDDLTPAVATLLRRDSARLRAGLMDADLIRAMSRRPAAAESIMSIALQSQLSGTGPRLLRLCDELGDKADRVLPAISKGFSTSEQVTLVKGLGGRMLSRSEVEEVTTALSALQRGGLDSVASGEVYETISRIQLSRGALKAKSGLKEGGEVIVGKHNGVNGIDGIGAAADGRPVIFEFTMDRVKDFRKQSPPQLSPKWTAERWNLLMESEEFKRALAGAGVDSKWLRKVSETEARAWSRKLVAAHESALSGSNRLAAELGPDDLLLLGRN